MSEERSSLSVSGLASFGGGTNSGRPSLGTTPSTDKARRASRNSIIDPKIVSKATASVVKGALPGEIDKRHYNVGAGLWILLCLGFVGYSIYSIAKMYDGRNHPATAFSYKDENWNFPDVAVCPMAGSWALWTMVAAGYKEPTETKYTGISNSDEASGQNIVKFFNKAGDECILIRYDNQPNINFTVTSTNTTWEATADLTFMTHVQLTELNTPERVRINYIQDSEYKAYKGAVNAYDVAKNASDIATGNATYNGTKVYMDDYYTEPNDYYLPYGLGYVTSKVKFLNVLEYSTKVRGSDGDGGLDAGVGSYISSISGEYFTDSDDGGSSDDVSSTDSSTSRSTATSHSGDSYHPFYSTAFDRYFYVEDTSTTTHDHTSITSSASGKPYSSSWYGNRRWQMHDFKSGYYVKKDDNDIWKTISYDNILTLGKQVQEPLDPRPKVITFPSGIAATPQYVDVRKMAFFGGGSGGYGKPRTYRNRTVTGEKVTYLCNSKSKGDETPKSWEVADDVYEVQFVVHAENINHNKFLEMWFIGWELYDYLLGPAYAFTTANQTGRSKASDYPHIKIDTSTPVHYWPLSAPLSLQQAFVWLACAGERMTSSSSNPRTSHYYSFTSGPSTDSSWLWGNTTTPGLDSASSDYCELLFGSGGSSGSTSTSSDDGTANGGGGRRLEADDSVTIDDFVNELFGGDAKAAVTALESMAAVGAASASNRGAPPRAQPRAPGYFAGDLNRHRSNFEEGAHAAGAAAGTEEPGRRRLADTGAEPICAGTYTYPNESDRSHVNLQWNCTVNLYGGAYYLNLYDGFANGWLDGGAKMSVKYRSFDTHKKTAVGEFQAIDNGEDGEFSHNNGKQRFTPRFVIGDKRDQYKEDYPCETSLDLTDATPFHLQYLKFTIQNQSPQVQHIVAIDPVDWFAMLGTIGGFWAYVAMVFGVVFVAVAGDDAPPEPVWTMRSQFGYIYEKAAGHFARLKCCVCLRKPVASVTPAKGRDPSLSSTSFLAQMEETKAEGSNAQIAPAFEPESKAGDSPV